MQRQHPYRLRIGRHQRFHLLWLQRDVYQFVTVVDREIQMSSAKRVAVGTQHFVADTFQLTVFVVHFFLRQDIDIDRSRLIRVTARLEHREGVRIIFLRIEQGKFLLATVVHVKNLMIFRRNQILQIVFRLVAGCQQKQSACQPYIFNFHRMCCL